MDNSLKCFQIEKKRKTQAKRSINGDGRTATVQPPHSRAEASCLSSSVSTCRLCLQEPHGLHHHPGLLTRVLWSSPNPSQTQGSATDHDVPGEQSECQPHCAAACNQLWGTTGSCQCCRPSAPVAPGHMHSLVQPDSLYFSKRITAKFP